MIDSKSIPRLAELESGTAQRAKALLESAYKEGIVLRITSAYRSMSEQADLYAQGRTRPGNIVTNAPPGRSWHNWRRAFDVVEIKNGIALWENPRWNRIGFLGKQLGLEWGGDWTSFQDRPHFEYHPGLTLDDMNNGSHSATAEYHSGVFSRIPKTVSLEGEQVKTTNIAIFAGATVSLLVASYYLLTA
jgi:peptidoglycan L-alanyl-D-glutamate endopeptidase CwlK